MHIHLTSDLPTVPWELPYDWLPLPGVPGLWHAGIAVAAIRQVVFKLRLRADLSANLAGSHSDLVRAADCRAEAAPWIDAINARVVEGRLGGARSWKRPGRLTVVPCSCCGRDTAWMFVQRGGDEWRCERCAPHNDRLSCLARYCGQTQFAVILGVPIRTYHMSKKGIARTLDYRLLRPGGAPIDPILMRAAGMLLQVKCPVPHGVYLAYRRPAVYRDLMPSIYRERLTARALPAFLSRVIHPAAYLALWRRWTEPVLPIPCLEPGTASSHLHRAPNGCSGRP